MDTLSPDREPAASSSLLTASQLAQRFAVSRNWVYQAIADDVLPHVRLGPRTASDLRPNSQKRTPRQRLNQVPAGAAEPTGPDELNATETPVIPLCQPYRAVDDVAGLVVHHDAAEGFATVPLDSLLQHYVRADVESSQDLGLEGG